jgi:hypothetical protein
MTAGAGAQILRDACDSRRKRKSMPQIPKRVVEIAQQLKQGEKPRRWKVKTMMK